MKTLFLIFLLSISFCLQSQNYVSEIVNNKVFEKLSGEPLSKKYGNVKSVKVVYDLKREKLYYLNADYYTYHYQFCQDLEQGIIDLENFNTINYSDSPRRRYLLANINNFEHQNIFVLEISPVDKMKTEHILFLYKTVTSSFTISNNISFLINSHNLQQQADQLKSKIPIITTDNLYKNQKYQSICNGTFSGRLRFINDLSDEINTIERDDIIVLNETPNFFPIVSGIIISEFQTPLSHLSLLGKNRNIPICVYKNIFSDSAILALNNTIVTFTVKDDNFEITPAKKRTSKTHATKHKIKIKYDLTVDSIIDIDNLNKRSKYFVGNKATNFSILQKLSKKHDFYVPEGAFAIPFYFYNQHIKQSNTDTLINRLIAYKSNNESKRDSISVILKTIRKSIKSAPIDSHLLQSVKRKIKQNSNYTHMRFRSSTNAEDSKYFSGAGLYSSKTGIINHDKKTIEKAIKKVWASLWNYTAFMEREYFGIDNQKVFMGILVHRSFPNEAVNGVAITKNPYRNNAPGFLVNAQLGNINVVDESSKTTCDQFICYPPSKDYLSTFSGTIEIITTSSENNGNLTMTKDEIDLLAKQLEVIKRYIYNRTATVKGYTDFGLDIEFKIDGENRRLYIKQVRPYND